MKVLKEFFKMNVSALCKKITQLFQNLIDVLIIMVAASLLMFLMFGFIGISGRLFLLFPYYAMFLDMPSISIVNCFLAGICGYLLICLFFIILFLIIAIPYCFVEWIKNTWQKAKKNVETNSNN